jgi:hypothetical protein
MTVEARWCETGTVAVVRLEEEEGRGGPQGQKTPNRPVGRLGRN